MGGPVRLDPSGDEALVFFEFLSRSDDQNSFVFEDQAEEKVLWTLAGQLERALAEIFDPHYKTLVAAARGQVRDPNA